MARTPIGQPKCPHCGGEHWGQRFHDCPFVKLVADQSATEEQRQNAASFLEAHRLEGARGLHPQAITGSGAGDSEPVIAGHPVSIINSLEAPATEARTDRHDPQDGATP